MRVNSFVHNMFTIFCLRCPWGNVVESLTKGGVNVGYKIKWIEDNLGISRKSIRTYEAKGLIPPNLDGKTRVFPDEEIGWLWTIKVFQGMGYSLQEISELFKHRDWNNAEYTDSISEKIRELEKKRMELDQLISYAKMVLFTGRIPYQPIEMGNMTIREFQKKSVEKWNLQMLPQIEAMSTGKMSTDANEEFAKMYPGFLENFFRIKIDDFLEMDALQKAIIKRVDQGPDALEVQLLVQILYDCLREIATAINLSPRQFGRIYSSSLMEGQVGVLNQERYLADLKIILTAFEPIALSVTFGQLSIPYWHFCIYDEIMNWQE